jgi:UDP-3-O-[3-hydroxymyristoyl] glucosamine N-acyltransferase
VRSADRGAGVTGSHLHPVSTPVAGGVLMPLTTGQIAELVCGELTGPPDVTIRTMQRIDAADPDQITFVIDARYAQQWSGCRAGAVLAARDLALQPSNGQAIIRVDYVDAAVIRVLEALAPPAVLPQLGIHPSAVVEPTATLGENVRVGPLCYVGGHSRIGDGAVLHANVMVLDECSIGAGTVLWSGVVIRERCSIGPRCILHPNTSIGADGFGYRPAPDGRGVVKVPQIGTVVIGEDVEIGANTCVDRAKFGTTEIGDGTKIDNLCQIAHNCRVGRCVIMAGGCAVAGSAVIGDGAILGGNVGVKDHVTIGAGAKIMGYAAVMNDVPPGETWGGYPAREARVAAREYASMRHLPELVKLLRKKG